MRFCLQIFLSLLFLTNCYSQSNNDFYNTINPNFSKLEIENQFVFSEKVPSKNISDLLKNDSLFTAIQKRLVNQGIYDKQHWLKINFINTSNSSDFVFEFNQTNVDSLKVFLVKKNKIVKTFKTKGLHFSKNNKPAYLSNRYAYVYDFQLEKNDSLSVYIKANVNDDPFRVINVLWSKEHYKIRERDIKTRSFYMASFLGFVILILLLSLAMYIFTFKKFYLYYLAFVLVIFTNLLCLRNFISPLIIEKYFFLGNNFSDMYGYVQVFFILLYTDEFFSLKEIRPKISKLIKRLAFFTLILFVSALFLRKYEWFYGFSYMFSKVFMIIVSFVIYGLAFSLLFKKKIMAFYYLAAYLPLLAFVIHYILTAMKLTNSYNPLEWEVVIFIEITVLTIAMAHRYYLMMKENSDYQKAIIKEKELGLKALIEAQESERSRIARELHDGVVQQIGSVILKSRNILSKMNLLQTKESQELLESLENSNKDLRVISHQMMPRALKELGIISALNDLLEGSLLYANIKYDFEHYNMQERVSNKIEITIYRITQELINNIIKHSKATEVNFQLFKTNNTVILIVEDNGVGFVPQKSKKGIGLLNISSRLDLVNGEVSFEPSPKNGTLVTIKIPVK